MNDEGTAVLSLTDEYGRSYTAWADSKKLKGATIYGKDYDEAVATYENQLVTAETLSKDLGITGSESLVYYKDGAAQSITGTYAGTFKGVGALGETLAGSFGGRGSVVEVYKLAANSYKVVVINTYVAVVGTIQKNDTTVTLTAKNIAGSTVATVTASVEGLTKGDIVSFNAGATVDKISAYNVTKLEGTDVKVTATGTDRGETYDRVNGEKVYLSLNANKDSDDGYAAISTATFYYDSYGNVLYYTDTTAFERTVDGFFYVEAAKSQDESADLLSSTEAKAKLKVIDLTTGAESTVDQAIVKDKDGEWYYANKNGAVPAAEKVAVGSDNNAVCVSGGSFTEGFYGYYKLDDGSYVLETLANASADSVSLSNTNKITEKDKAVVALVSDKYANSSTVLTYLTQNNNLGPYTATTVTGIANFPNLTAQTVTINGDSSAVSKVLYVANDKNIITQVYVIAPKTEGDNKVDPKTYAMLKAQGDITTDDNGNTTYAYTFTVNKEDVEYTNDASLGTFDDIKNTVYTLKTDGKFEATAVNSANVKTGEVIQVADSYVVVKVSGTNYVYYTDAYTQTTDTTRDECGLVKGAAVTVYLSDVTGNAAYIVVTAAPAA
jgi:hypothetical protein